MRQYNILIFFLLILIPAISISQTSTTISNIGIDAKVIAPITGLKTNDLDFGTLTRSNISGVVEIKFASEGGGVSITATGGVSLLTSPSNPAASFEITGENNALYSINLPGDNDVKIKIAGTNNEMTVTNFTHNSGLVLSETGTDSFSVGATLNVGANQIAGDYEGTFAITILYQ